jgi:hypothetical protein
MLMLAGEFTLVARSRNAETTMEKATLIPAEHGVPSNYNTRCSLIVVNYVNGRETWNGDVIFETGGEEELVIGLHPEFQNLAVRNSVFRRGKLAYTYRWVETTYPAADNSTREYSFQFTSSAAVLKCDDRVCTI